MTLWMIEPRDTLVLRDGRPMEGTGLQIDSLEMPQPSAIAGFLRTRSGSDENGRFRFAGDDEACARLLETPVAGPWLARLDPDGGVVPLLPAPGDAEGLEAGRDAGKAEFRLARLGWRRDPLGPGECTDHPDGLELLFFEREEDSRGVPPPRYWNWNRYLGWLEDPVGSCGEHARRDLGWDAGDLEHRTHLCIDRATQAASEGMLFSLGHRRFVQLSSDRRLSTASRFVLVARTDLDGIQAGTWPFAGERRLVQLRRQEGTPPEPTETLIRAIVRDRRARLLLLTPAFFAEGWRPGWILEEGNGLRVQLRAGTVRRPLSISGWNLARRRPKAARRAVPAGATYFLSFEGEEEAIESFVRRHWWQTVSDDAQDRRDGFGLAVFGVDVPLDGGTE